jgi:hypothetical protein
MFFHCCMIFVHIPANAHPPPNYLRWWVNGRATGRQPPVYAFPYVTSQTTSTGEYVEHELRLGMQRDLNSISPVLNGTHIDTHTFDVARFPELATSALRFALKPLVNPPDNVHLRALPEPVLLGRLG